MIEWASWEKRCTICKLSKDAASDFYRNRAKADGLDDVCKVCRKRWNHTPQQVATKKRWSTLRTLARRKQRVQAKDARLVA